MAAPLRRVEIALVAYPAAGARRAALHPVAFPDHDRDVEPHEGPDVADSCPVGADDLHRLPHPGDGRRNLAHPLILAPRILVDLGQEFGLGREIDGTERIFGGIKRAVGADRRRHHGAALPRLDRAHGGSGPLYRRLGELGGMRKTGRLARYRAQPEALRGVEGGLAVFEEKLAVVHAGEGLADPRLDASTVHAGAVEEEVVGGGEISH